MSPNPKSFIEHLRDAGYHPRSDKHSNALGLAIAHDLVTQCEPMAAKAAAGQLVFDLNFPLRAGTADWNVDLVLGIPPQTCPPEEGLITRATPSRVQVAVEIKSVMTEHRKAVKNRKRDLEAHHEHVHNYSNEAIAGGVLVVNGAARFTSPLRSEVTEHRNIEKLVQHCLEELRSVATRGGKTGYGLEASCALVVETDNQNHSDTKYMTRPPAPQVGDPLHYDSFIQAVCDYFHRRFA